MFLAIGIILLLLLFGILIKRSRRMLYSDFSTYTDEDVFERQMGKLGSASGLPESHGKGIDIQPVKRCIVKAFKVIRRKVIRGEELYEFEKWLYDNNYIFKKILKEGATEGFFSLPHNGRVPRIVIFSRAVVALSQGKIDRERLNAALNAFSGKKELTYNEIENLDAALQYAVLEKIADVGKKCIYYNKMLKIAVKGKNIIKKYANNNLYIYFTIKRNVKLAEKLNAFLDANARDYDNIDYTFSALIVENNVLTSSLVTSLQNLSVSTADKYKNMPVYRTMSEDAVFCDSDEATKRIYLSKIAEASDKINLAESEYAARMLRLAKSDNIFFGIPLLDNSKGLKKSVAADKKIIVDKKNKKGGAVYFAANIIITALLSAAAGAAAFSLYPSVAAAVLGVLGFIAPSGLIADKITGLFVKERPVCRLSFGKIPENASVEVAVPLYVTSYDCLIESFKNIKALAAVNDCGNVRYTLLIDFKRADRVVDDRDAELLTVIKDNIGGNVGAAVRRRVFDGAKYCGRERKRGAVEDYAAYLYTGDKDNFSYLSDHWKKPKYLIVLDADSVMCPSGVLSAVQAFEHPQNSARDMLAFSCRTNLHSVKGFYGRRYLFNAGTDNYPEYSDFAYKLTDSAVFCGKGIIKLQAYYDKLNRYLPENRILSHDLLEGALLDTGASGVAVYEDVPDNLACDEDRRLRWARGDIQLLPFLNLRKNSDNNEKISIFMRYTMFKNAFSLFFEPYILTLFLLAAFLELPYLAIFAAVIFSIDFIFQTLNLLVSAMTDRRLIYCFRDFAAAMYYLIERVALLPYRAVINTALIAVTSFRMAVTKKGLLNWKPFAVSEKKHVKRRLSEKQSGKLAAYAEEIYGYFKAAPALVPDHYREYPSGGFANYTSPTDIAFSLIAAACAYKLKFCPYDEAESRVSEILAAVDKLKKWNGHLYNWYSLNDKKPLPPYFVSSVDSGNFIASLLVIKQIFGKKIAEYVDKFIKNADFKCFYDSRRGMFHIGYNQERRRFEGHYDNLMSEARLLCYIGVAGGLPRSLWDNLNREYTSLNGNTMLSWGGTAFEYLFADLFMKPPEYGALNKTCKNAVDIMKRGGCKGFWGISESGYFDFDDKGNYLYRAFGQDNLSLKSELNSCVISPYSSFISVRYKPKAALSNLERIKKLGAYGRYGFFEAVDFTRSPRIVLEFMSHHLGMSLAAITNYLTDDSLIRAFEANDIIRGASQLLCEREYCGKAHKPEKNKYVYDEIAVEPYRFDRCGDYAVPVAAVLGNADYSVVIDDNGVGYSKYKNIWLNCFDNDISKPSGSFFAVKCGNSLTSPARYPFDNGNTFNASFNKREIVLCNYSAGLTQSITVPDFFGGELRRIKIENLSDTSKEYTVYFYTDLCLNTRDAYLAHPVYSDLFVESEVVDKVLYCKRRGKEKNIGAFAALYAPENSSYISSRYNFLGRCNGFENAAVFDGFRTNADDNGTVLDGCLGAVTTVTIAAGADITLDYYIAVNDNYSKLSSDISRAKNPRFAEYMSKIPHIVENKKGQELDSRHSAYFLRLLPELLYMPYPQEKLYSVCRNHKLFTELSDNFQRKVLLLRYDGNRRELKQAVATVRLLLSAGVPVSLVIGYEEKDGYYTPVRREIMQHTDGVVVGRDVFLKDNVPMDILSAIAFGDFSKYEDNNDISEKIKLIKSDKVDDENINGYVSGEGVFTADGYSVIPYGDCTLLPYSNIICGKIGGTVVTADGAGFTYYGNSRESKLTVLSNDFTYDAPSEYLLFDCGGRRYDLLRGAKFVHGLGMSTAYFYDKNLNAEIRQYIIGDGGAKVYEVTVTAADKLKGRLILNLDLALGAHRDKTFVYYKVADEIYEAVNLKSGVSCYMYAEDADYFDNLFDRARCGKIAGAAMHGTSFAAGLKIDIDGGGSETRYFVFGGDYNTVIAAKNGEIEKMKAESLDYFDSLNPFEITTDNTALNILFNYSLPYQIVSSRINGRASFYQSGGAIGFRDILQDTKFLLYGNSERAREIILNAASHTYYEGDVMHWWHGERHGVRTRISDDKLFLPYIVTEYIDATGDGGILEEEVRYLDSKPLAANEKNRYEIPEVHKKTDTLLLHLERIMDSAYRLGENGLLLIGGGDWNDALDSVGTGRAGESVWLSEFYVFVADRMSKLYDDNEKMVYIDRAEKLRQNIIKAYTGKQFKRLVTPSGEWLGDGYSKKLTIDIISQAWASLSDVCDKKYRNIALNAAKNTLIDKKNGIIMLLAPPLDDSSFYGYINLYPKGIRENGGQYTHGAIWYLMALVKEGRSDEAFELFNMINPVLKCADRENVLKYMGEPYVLAADVYSNSQHPGRVGWSWYTGSASWCFQLIIEGFLGVTKKGDALVLNPKPPKYFDGYTVKYRYKSSLYTLRFKKRGRFAIIENGVEISGTNAIALSDNEMREIDVLY